MSDDGGCLDRSHSDCTTELRALSGLGSSIKRMAAFGHRPMDLGTADMRRKAVDSVPFPFTTVETRPPFDTARARASYDIQLPARGCQFLARFRGKFDAATCASGKCAVCDEASQELPGVNRAANPMLQLLTPVRGRQVRHALHRTGTVQFLSSSHGVRARSLDCGLRETGKRADFRPARMPRFATFA